MLNTGGCWSNQTHSVHYEHHEVFFFRLIWSLLPVLDSAAPTDSRVDSELNRFLSGVHLEMDNDRLGESDCHVHT